MFTQGNPLLTHIRTCSYQFSDEIEPDFDMGSGVCALFLSLRFHKRHPDYILNRMDSLGKKYRVRVNCILAYLARHISFQVLLVLVDEQNVRNTWLLLNRLCYRLEYTLIISRSIEECAEYLESYKLFEKKVWIIRS